MEIRAAVGARDEPERLRQLTRGEQRDTADRPPRDRSTRGQAVLTLVVAIVVVQHPPRDARRTGAALGRHALDSEEALLQPHPVPGIPDQVAARPDDAVAGYDDGHRVVTKRLRHGAHSPWRSDLAGGAILDARYALLGPRDQNGAERRGKDPVEERAASEVGETRRQALARQLFGGRRRAAPHAHGALDRAVADKVLAAACARARVRLDARRRRAVRVADGGGDERRLDLLAHGRLARHLSSLPSGSSYPLRLRRILRRAWNTWARALSGEQSRLRPMAS